MKKSFLKWFTLVELIIVITILAILSTIWFVSFQSYTKNTRDSNRLTTLINLENSLKIYFTKNNSYPEAESKTEVQASWTILSYQWIIWDNISSLIWFNKVPLDPVDSRNYLYATNQQKNLFQVMWFLEWDEYKSLSFYNQKVNAASLIDRSPRSKWDNIWIFLDWNNESITWSIVNIFSWSVNYKVYFSNKNKVESNSWSQIFSNIYSWRNDLINNKDLAKFDDSLVVYFDMETTLTTWTWLVLLKDLSKYWNNWRCVISWWVTVNCWVSPWPVIVNWNWNSWKAMLFDWIDDRVIVDTNTVWIWSWMTVLAFTKLFDQTFWSNTYHKDIVRSCGWWWLWALSTNWDYNTTENIIADSRWVASWSNWQVNPPMKAKKLSYNLLWLVLDRNSSESSVIINSNKYSQLNVIRTKPSTTSFNIWFDCWWPLSWIIDEVRIYNRVLSDLEIQTIYDTIK